MVWVQHQTILRANRSFVWANGSSVRFSGPLLGKPRMAASTSFQIFSRLSYLGIFCQKSGCKLLVFFISQTTPSGMPSVTTRSVTVSGILHNHLKSQRTQSVRCQDHVTTTFWRLHFPYPQRSEGTTRWCNHSHRTSYPDSTSYQSQSYVTVAKMAEPAAAAVIATPGTIASDERKAIRSSIVLWSFFWVCLGD